MNRVHLIITLVLLLMGTEPSVAEDLVLPMGSATAPVADPHFPNRVYAFIWRNWGLVPPEKLAAILNTTPASVADAAASMGLPKDIPIESAMAQRGYLSLIRRNWHLLPYEQLLTLLDMTPERLDVMLREEDFLWIKLGRVKPACEPLVYSPPNDAAQARAAEIRHVLETDFGPALTQPAEPRFDFVRQIAMPMPGFVPSPQDPSEMQRIVYSYVAVYGDPLLHPELNPYPDGLLQRLSSVGINGVWLHAVLRDLAPGGDAFPEFGEGHEARLTNLRALVDRARQWGVGVYLYINEPRAMRTAFFENRPDMAGVKEAELTAMCTSHPAVRQWMGDALAYIFREVPGLAGIYAITASENLTNCASHGAWTECEHCKTRSDTEIIAEVVAVMEEGVHRGNPAAKVLISDWGWRGHGEAPELIQRLPKSVCLMSVSEWNLPIERGGIKSNVGEYSISSVGPGPRALAEWNTAQASALPCGAEIQFNNTCEIATIPYLPVMDLVAEHCRNLVAKAKLDAMLIGWTMGGFPSPNLHLAERLSRTPAPDMNAVLDQIAQERFGPEAASDARRAWTLMSNAFREYPFHISVVYTCPVQWGAANPLYPERTGYSATMWGIPYDDIDGWRGPYPPDVFAAQFEKMAQGWQQGIEALRIAVDKTPAPLKPQGEGDLRLASAAGIHFQSVANQARFVIARNALKNDGATGEQRAALRLQLQKTLESEIEQARMLYTLSCQDSRIGFEPSCQYFYLPRDLIEKVINCRWLIAHLDEWTK